MAATYTSAPQQRPAATQDAGGRSATPSPITGGAGAGWPPYLDPPAEAPGDAAGEAGMDLGIEPPAPKVTGAAGGGRKPAPGLAPARPARLGGTNLVIIEDPPRMAPQLLQAVRQRTGLSADEHHDRVRADMARLSRTLHLSQVEAVRRTEWIARDLRRDIERDADAALGGAIATAAAIDAQVEAGCASLADTAALLKHDLTNAGTVELEQILSARSGTTAVIWEEMRAHSTLVNEIMERFAAEQVQFNADFGNRFRTIGATGEDPGRDAPEFSEAVTPDSGVLREGVRIADALMTQRRSASTEQVSYMLFQMAGWTRAHAEQEHDEWVARGAQHADGLNAPEVIAIWTSGLLDLANPIVAQAMAVSIRNTISNEVDGLGNRAAIEQARQAAITAVGAGLEAAQTRLRDLGKTARTQLLQAARNAHQALLEQAASAENALLTLAPALADQWRELADQADGLIAPDVLLDHHKVGPPLAALLRTAAGLLVEQLGTVRAQDAEARRGVAEAIEQLHKAAASVEGSVREGAGSAVQGTRLEMVGLVVATTGSMSEGARAVVAEAARFADAAAARLAARPGGIAQAVGEHLEERIRPAYDEELQNFKLGYRDDVSAMFFRYLGELYPDVITGVIRELTTKAQTLDDAMPQISLGFVEVSSAAALLMRIANTTSSTELGAGLTLVSSANAALNVVSADADEDKVITTLAETMPEGRPALRECFNERFGGGLPDALVNRMRAGLSGAEFAQASLLLQATPESDALAALLAIADERTMFGINAQTRDAVLGSLSGEELRLLLQFDGQSDVVQRATMGLAPEALAQTTEFGSALQIRRFASRMDTELVGARDEGEQESVRWAGQLESQANRAIGGEFYAHLVTDRQREGFLNAAIRQQQGDRGVDVDALSDEEVVERFAAYATGALTVVDRREVSIFNLGPTNAVAWLGNDEISYGPASSTSVMLTAVNRYEALSADAAEAMRGVLVPGRDSDEGWSSYAFYWYQNQQEEADARAGNPLAGLADMFADEGELVDLTRAFEDPEMDRAFDEWNRLRTMQPPAAPGRIEEAWASYDGLRARHERRSAALAQRMNATPGSLAGPRGASDWVGERLGAVLGRTHGDMGRTLGTSLATTGRPDLLALSVLASRGMGTNDALLELAYEGRDREEIERANLDYAARIGTPGDATALNRFVDREISGDLALRIEVAREGVPHTEAERAQIELLRTNQQLAHGTGLLASITMLDTPESQLLQRAQAELRDEISARLPAGVLPFDERGLLTDQALAAMNAAEEREANEAWLAREKGGEAPHTRPTDEEIGTSALELVGRRDLSRLTLELGLAVDGYQAEIDRQEAAALKALEIFGLILGVALLPLGPIWAGIIAAAVTGLGTILIKQGFRGERYGAEELWVDLAMTAVDVAAAAGGGVWAARAGKATSSLKGLARFLATTRSAVARGAVTQGLSGLAHTAADENTWRDGLAAGLGRTLFGGLRGAVVGAITEGLSTAMGHGLQNRIDGSNLVRVGGKANILYTGLAEGLTSAVSATAGEVAGFGLDAARAVAEGEPGPQDVGEALGELFVRELVTGVARGAFQAHLEHRYQSARQRLLDRGEPLTSRERRGLRRMARAAGQTDDIETKAMAAFEAEIARNGAVRRVILDGFAPPLRDLLARAPLSALQQAEALTAGPSLPDLRVAAIEALSRQIGLGPDLLARALDGELHTRGLRRTEAERASQELRDLILQRLPVELRGAVGPLELGALARLPPEQRVRAAELIAAAYAETAKAGRWEVPPLRAQVEELHRLAPGIPAVGLLRDLQRSVGAALDARAQVRHERTRLLEALPERARRAAARLPPAELRLVHDLIIQGDFGTQAQRDAIVRALRAQAPSLDPRPLLRGLDHAVATVRAARRTPAPAGASPRDAVLAELPAALRGPLSALSDEAILHLRALAWGQAPRSLRIVDELVRQARAAHPGLDARALRGALVEAISFGARQRAREAAQQASMRSALVAELDPEDRRRISDIPIVVAGADEIAAHLGDPAATAGIVVLRGRPTLLVAEGADPHALFELAHELLAIRSADHGVAARALDERTARGWSALSVRERTDTWVATLDLEIAAVRSALKQRLSSASAVSGQAAEQLRARSDALRVRLTTLQDLRNDTRRIGLRQRVAIAMGRAPMPDHLTRPPRLSHRGAPRTDAPSVHEGPLARSLQARLEQIEREGATGFQVRKNRLEQGMDTAGRLLYDSTGKPWGFEARGAYEVREYSDGVTELRVAIHLQPGRRVTPAELAKVRRDAQLGLDRYYAGRHRVAGPDGASRQLRVTLDFVDDPAMAHHVVSVRKGNGGANQTMWFVDGDPTTHAHEITHMLGLLDEYEDSWHDGWIAVNRAGPNAPGVRTDGGLMGNYWIYDPAGNLCVDPRTRVLPRYIQQIGADIASARPGQTAATPAPARGRAVPAPAPAPDPPGRLASNTMDGGKQLNDSGKDVNELFMRAKEVKDGTVSLKDLGVNEDRWKKMSPIERIDRLGSFNAWRNMSLDDIRSRLRLHHVDKSPADFEHWWRSNKIEQAYARGQRLDPVNLKMIDPPYWPTQLNGLSPANLERWVKGLTDAIRELPADDSLRELYDKAVQITTAAGNAGRPFTAAEVEELNRLWDATEGASLGANPLLRALWERAREEMEAAARSSRGEKLADDLKAWRAGSNKVAKLGLKLNELDAMLSTAATTVDLTKVQKRRDRLVKRIEKVRQSFTEQAEKVYGKTREEFARLVREAVIVLKADHPEWFDRADSAILRFLDDPMPSSLQVHHRLYKSRFPELALLAENLVLALRGPGKGALLERHELEHMVGAGGHTNLYKVLDRIYAGWLLSKLPKDVPHGGNG